MVFEGIDILREVGSLNVHFWHKADVRMRFSLLGCLLCNKISRQ